VRMGERYCIPTMERKLFLSFFCLFLVEDNAHFYIRYARIISRPLHSPSGK
jgi:hypothetical protein